MPSTGPVSADPPTMLLLPRLVRTDVRRLRITGWTCRRWYNARVLADIADHRGHPGYWGDTGRSHQTGSPGSLQAGGDV